MRRKKRRRTRRGRLLTRMNSLKRKGQRSPRRSSALAMDETAADACRRLKSAPAHQISTDKLLVVYNKLKSCLDVSVINVKYVVKKTFTP
jgi:hypothetical protein